MYAKIKDIILKRTLLTLEKGGKISIFRMSKVNGENAQISFSHRLDSWIIASKNVTLIAKSKEQVHKYQNNR